MHSLLRFSLACIALGLGVGACSSESDANGGADAAASSAGGKASTGGASSAGGSGTGGGSSTSTGGAMVNTCETDAGDSGCRQCLGATCCDTYTACEGDAECAAAFKKQQTCFQTPGAETSDCFGTLVRDLSSDGGSLPMIGICILTNCKTQCGGASVI